MRGRTGLGLLRWATGMKQVEITRLTGISPAILHHLESGEVKLGAEDAVTIAVLLDAPVEAVAYKGGGHGDTEAD